VQIRLSEFDFLCLLCASLPGHSFVFNQDSSLSASFPLWYGRDFFFFNPFLSATSPS
jgi:hypothetical protein